MKKSIICAVLFCSLILMATGCNKSNDNSSSDTSTPPVVSYMGGDLSSATQTPDKASSTTISQSDTDTETDTETDTQSETDSEETDTDTITETDSDTEFTVSAEEIESSLTGYEEEISGSWTAKYILNDQQNEVDGSMIYGSAYSQYGGELTLNSDGTFSVRMGASTDDSSTRGTYSYSGGGAITMQYDNDSVADFERCTINGSDAIAMPVDLFGDIYTVYFMK